MSRRVKCKKEDVLEAIKNSKGIISVISKRLKCAWSTANIAVHKWNETEEAYNNEIEETLDNAESKLFELIDEKNEGCIKWYLSKKGKSRGYGDEETLAEKIDNKLEVVIDSLGADSESKN